MLYHRSKILAQYFYLLSVIFTAGAFFLAFATYNLTGPLTTGYILYPAREYLWLLPLSTAILYLLLLVFRMYIDINGQKFWADIFKLFEITVIAVSIIYSILFMFKITYVSRLFIGYFAVYSFAALASADYAGRKLLKGLKRRGYSIRNVVLVRSPKDPTGGRVVAEAVASREYLGVRLVKEINKDDADGLINFVLNNPVDEVVFAVTGEEIMDMMEIALLLEEKGITVKLPINFIPFKKAKTAMEKVGGYPFISFYTAPEDDIMLFLKRLTDIAASLTAMAILLLPSLVIGAAIMMDSEGTVLYKSKRVGKNGRLFTFYKFRTMRRGSDELRSELIKEYSADGIEIKLKNDPRITAVGRVLRKTSLDEIPQFFNVLRGDMSLVGPRPPMPDEVKKYSIRQMRRISMKPGITCLWQISGRSSLSFDDRVALDLKYIDEWSLKLDIIILLKTIPAVLSARGAL